MLAAATFGENSLKAVLIHDVRFSDHIGEWLALRGKAMLESAGYLRSLKAERPCSSGPSTALAAG